MIERVKLSKISSLYILAIGRLLWEILYNRPLPLSRPSFHHYVRHLGRSNHIIRIVFPYRHIYWGGIQIYLFPGIFLGKGFQIGIQASTKIRFFFPPCNCSTEEARVLINDFQTIPQLLHYHSSGSIPGSDHILTTLEFHSKPRNFPGHRFLGAWIPPLFLIRFPTL